ncbi:MAG TPA: hypothetical protein VMC02_04370 [Steroidobacteraceae bacterium]|nr:hypothetical protein [Steroidobacteraceae bacterium]
MMLAPATALATALAIVVQDHTALRAGAQSGALELTTLWQGDVVEVRAERAGYLQVYNDRRERGGYLRSDAVRPLALTPAEAPALLAVMRFLRDSHGSEALGISYGAAYLKAAPPHGLTGEPLEAVALMAERLADSASGSASPGADVGAHLDVVGQFGIHMRTFERNGRMQVCYDGELFQRVLTLPQASAEERALAALSLTRPDCIDPALGPAARAILDEERGAVLDTISERDLTPLTRSRLHARRATVWAAVAFEQARHGRSSVAAGQRSLAEFAGVQARDLGEDRRSDYADAAVRVSASRWAGVASAHKPDGLMVAVTAGEPGQTCVAVQKPQAAATPLVRRCTYGVAWPASAQVIAQGQALVLAVQPLESWRELWVFHERAESWTVDVLSPGTDDPDEGYIEYAGYVPAARRLLVAREVKVHGHIRRSFEELRLADLLTVRQASDPALLRDFGRWQDARWRSDTLSLR